jgi:hypothetical protein
MTRENLPKNWSYAAMETAKFGRLVLATSFGLTTTIAVANESNRDVRINKTVEIPDRKSNPISTLINDLLGKMDDFLITDECNECQSGTKVLN